MVFLIKCGFKVQTKGEKQRIDRKTKKKKLKGIKDSFIFHKETFYKNLLNHSKRLWYHCYQKPIDCGINGTAKNKQ